MADPKLYEVKITARHPKMAYAIGSTYKVAASEKTKLEKLQMIEVTKAKVKTTRSTKAKSK